MCTNLMSESQRKKRARSRTRHVSLNSQRKKGKANLKTNLQSKHEQVTIQMKAPTPSIPVLAFDPASQSGPIQPKTRRHPRETSPSQMHPLSPNIRTAPKLESPTKPRHRSSLPRPGMTRARNLSCRRPRTRAKNGRRRCISSDRC